MNWSHIVRGVNKLADHNFLDCFRSNPCWKVRIIGATHIWSEPLVSWIVGATIKQKTESLIDRSVQISLNKKLRGVWTVVVFDLKVFNFIHIWIKDVSSDLALWKVEILISIFSINHAIRWVFDCAFELGNDKLPIMRLILCPVCVPIRDHECYRHIFVHQV